MKGTRGNNRQDGTDLDKITVELTHKTVADTKIGRYEQQGIDCTGTGGTFQITYNGVSTGALQFNDAFVNLETALNGLSTLGPNAVSVSNPNSLANVCASGNWGPVKSIKIHEEMKITKYFNSAS